MRRALTVVLSVLFLMIAGIGVGWATAPDPESGPATGTDNPWLVANAGEYTAATPTSVLIGDAGVRVFGSDRYETAVAISREVWDINSTVIVYLASGTSFPDALAGSASTLTAGPILLTLPAGLPTITLAEIQRLQPCIVVAFGGPSAISDNVLSQAQVPADPNQAKCQG